MSIKIYVKYVKNNRDFYTTKMNLPTGALDSHTSQDVMRLMQRLVREQKRTLVMVTHDRSQAEYADRVLEIIDGKIVHITENRRKEENERA